MKVTPSSSKGIAEQLGASQSSKVKRKPVLQIGASANPRVERSTRDSSVQISRTGHEMAMAKKEMNNTPEVRQDRVDALKKQIESGNYHPDFDQVAEKLVSDHKELPF